MSVHGVGIDVTDVARVTRLLDERGDRFTHRWFTPEELADGAQRRNRGLAFAARLAAKEAVWKALRLHGDRAVPWRSISILELGGTPRAVLSGNVAAEAASAGVDSIRVQVDVVGSVAVSVAIASASSR